MFGRDSHSMNPAQRLEVLKKEMEHLAMEKELLQAQTRNLEMEREVAKLRQGMLNLQSGTSQQTSQVVSSAVPAVKEIVVTPRRIVKKTVNKSPIAPAFSPPRFIRKFDEAIVEKSPILTPTAKLVMAKMEAKANTKNQVQPKQPKVSSFHERKQISPKIETSSEFNDRSPQSTVPFSLGFHPIQPRTSPEKPSKSDLEKFEKASSSARTSEKEINSQETRREGPVKSGNMEKKKDSSKSDILTPTARKIKADMEAKQAAKQIKQTSTSKILTTDNLDSIDCPIITVKQPVSSLSSSKQQKQSSLPTAQKPAEPNLELRRSKNSEEMKLTSTSRTLIEKSPSPSKVIQVTHKTQTETKISRTETKLTPTARAVKDSIVAKKEEQKKQTPSSSKCTMSEVEPTPSLPDTPKSRGVHFAKVEAVHLNKPFTADIVMTPEKVRGIIKPPRLTRRALHPEKESPKPRRTNRSSVLFNKTHFDGDEAQDTSVSESQVSDSSASSSITYTKMSTSHGKKRQIDTDSSNDDDIYSEVVTPQPTKKRKTYNTTPHPVKSKRRTQKSLLNEDDDSLDDDADISDAASDVFINKPSEVTTANKGMGQRKSGNKRSGEEDDDKEPEIVETTKSRRSSLQQKTIKKSIKSNKSDESNDDSEQSIVSTPTRKRRTSLLSKQAILEANEESEDSVRSTPSKRRRSSVLSHPKSGRGRLNEESNEESEDSVVGTPSKRRRPSILSAKGAVGSSTMPAIPEEKSKLTPAQREIMERIKASQEEKSAKSNKSQIKDEKVTASTSNNKDDSEDSSPEHGKKKGKSSKVEKKSEETTSNSKLTPTARLVLAKMQNAPAGKKKTIVKEPVAMDTETESDASDSSRRRSKRR